MTSLPEDTCWTLIRSAARGGVRDREEFARRYLPIVRAYLDARWRASPLQAEIDDVVQEVFVACFRDGGALEHLDSQHESGFRALLYSVTRNTARSAERQRVRRSKEAGCIDPAEMPACELSLSRVFEREYAHAMLREAREVMARKADGRDDGARRRVELLRLRFEQGLPIREIAKAWNEDPTRVHREYATARAQFRAALTETVAEAEKCPRAHAEEKCRQLLRSLRS